MSRFTTGRFSGATLVALPLLGLNFLAWIILLAGVSALQHRCSSQQEVVNADVPVGSIYPASRCSNVYRFQWWIVILQLFTLVVALASVALGWVLHNRIALVGLLATVTVLLVLDTNTFLYVHDAISQSPLWRRSNCYFAGALISSFFNFLLILTLGHDGELPTRTRGKTAAPVETVPPTRPAGTTAAPVETHPTTAPPPAAAV